MTATRQKAPQTHQKRACRDCGGLYGVSAFGKGREAYTCNACALRMLNTWQWARHQHQLMRTPS